MTTVHRLMCGLKTVRGNSFKTESRQDEGYSGVFTFAKAACCSRNFSLQSLGEKVLVSCDTLKLSFQSPSCTVRFFRLRVL